MDIRRFFGRHKKAALSLLAGLLVLASSGFSMWRASSKEYSLPAQESSFATGSIPFEPEPSETSKTAPVSSPADAQTPASQASFVTVFVSGQVKNPGVVTLQAGSRLQQAVEKCGGLSANADLNRTNLALIVQDEGHYVILEKGEQAPSAPFASAASPTESSGSPSVSTPASTGKIDLNSADAAALNSLPGIGPVLAERILQKRQELGGFRSVEDLQQVSGIGQKKFEQMKDHVTVAP